MKLYLNKRSSTVCFSTIQRTFYLFKCTLYGPRHKVEPENNHKIQKVHTRNLIVISYRDHKTEMFFVPRAQPEVRNTSRFMVECTNVTFYSDGFIKTRFGPAGRHLYAPPLPKRGHFWQDFACHFANIRKIISKHLGLEI